MKAGDIRCPACGEGLRDVAPDYELAWSDELSLDPTTTKATQAACTNGHRVIVTATREPPALDVQACRGYPPAAP